MPGGLALQHAAPLLAALVLTLAAAPSGTLVCYSFEAIYGSLHEEQEHPRESPRPPPPGSPDAQEESDADLG